MDQATLRAMLHYSPCDGVFTWKIDRRRARKGMRAGSVKPTGYRQIVINGCSYLEHRLAWIWVHGTIPQGLQIDHMNGDKQDNRIGNLRLSTSSQNSQNQRKAHKESKSGVLGAYFDSKRNNYFSQIYAAGKLIFLGRFNSAEEAGAAYLKAKRELHEFCTI